MTHRSAGRFEYFSRCGAWRRARTVGAVRVAGGAAREEDTMVAPLAPRSDTAAPVLAAVAELAPRLAARAAETEAGRRLAPDVVDELRSAGCFRMLLPRSHGGDEVDLVTGMRVLEELARADGSVGWTVGIGGSGWLDLCHLPRATFDALYAGGPIVTAGVIAPSGTASPVDGGYRISGRWGFASGCEHADRLYGNCFDTGEVNGSGEGPPPMRVAVFAPEEVAIEDTWTVSGLNGTGSHHVVVDDVVVPADRTYALLTAEPCVDTAMTRIPLPTPFASLLASVAIGIAQGALDDVLGLAPGKVPLFAPAPLASGPVFQQALATADARLRAARAILREDAGELFATAEADEDITVELRARVRASATWATDTAAAVVDAAYRAGGGTSLYATSPLQRRLRDVHAVTQHFLVRPDTMVMAGAVLAGQDTDTTLL
jgi:alkylation response protein AidB-like acyl-CoA dehydrogenase